MGIADKDKNLLKKFRPSGIRYQIVLGVALVHLLMMTIFVFDLVDRQHEFLLEQNLEKTRSLAQTLAVNSCSWVLANDVVGLAEIISSVQSIPDLRYAMVIDRDGRVMAHTDPGKVGLYITDEKSRSLLKATQPQLQIIHSDHLILDIAAPVICATGECVAWTRIGQGQESITRNLGIASRNGILYTLLAIGLGSAIAMFIGYRLTSGLGRLLAVSGQIRDGRRDIRMEITRNDEVSRLGEGLNEMLDAMELRERENVRQKEFYERIIENTITGIFVTDEKDTIYYANRRLSVIAGAATADIVGKNILTDYREETTGEFLQHYQDAKEKLQPVSYNSLLVATPGGKAAYLSGWCLPLVKTGIFEGMICTVEDVTELKEAGEARRLSEEKYRSLIQGIQAAVVVHDSGTRIVTCNSLAQKLLCLTENQMLGKTAIDPAWRFLREDGSSMPPGEYPVNRVLTTRHPLRDFVLGVHCPGMADPVWVLVNADPAINERGEIEQVIVTFVDITYRKLTAEELRRERDFTATVLGTVASLVLVIDQEGHIVSFNKACEECTGYTMEEVRGRKFWDLFLPPEEMEHVMQIWQTLIKTAAPSQALNYWMTKTGERRLIDWSNAVIKRPDGTIEFIISTGIDITERKKAEDALRQLNKELDLRVRERTIELEQINRLFVGRELKMSELKEKIEELEMKLMEQGNR